MRLTYELLNVHKYRKQPFQITQSIILSVIRYQSPNLLLQCCRSLALQNKAKFRIKLKFLLLSQSCLQGGFQVKILLWCVFLIRFPHQITVYLISQVNRFPTLFTFFLLLLPFLAVFTTTLRNLFTNRADYFLEVVNLHTQILIYTIWMEYIIAR